MSSLQDRLEQVNAEIRQACADASRSQEEITLIVVTKNHPFSLVENLVKLGVRNFGENRDQEAKLKAQQLEESEILERNSYNWHFVGQLQSNKVKSVLNYANYIHSLDRQSLLSELDKQTRKVAQENSNFKKIKVFLELNLTNDPNRGGVQLSDLTEFAERVLLADQLELCGVMAVASLDGDANRDFEAVWRASQNLQRVHADAKFISAGMSDDFSLAIKHGATHLRIGTAITGKR